MDIKTLIDAIASGNTQQADETFASLMTAKADQAVAVVYDHAAATFMESEEDQIDELSKSTLGSYVKKAARSVSARSSLGGRFDNEAEHSNNYKQIASNEKLASDFMKDAQKRVKGIGKATDRLTKEAVEVNENQKDAE